LSVADLFADGDEFPYHLTKTPVLGDLLAGTLDGLSLGDDAGYGLMAHGVGQRVAGSVAGRILLGTVTGKLATPAETLDQGAGT
jgi:hypothetical protein